MSEIGDRLRDLRLGVELSQREAADRLGISTQYISALETGNARPAVWPLLAELARLYGTSTDFILGMSSSPEPVSATAKLLMSEEAWALIAALQGLTAEQRAALLRLLGSKHAPDALRAVEDEVTHQVLASLGRMAPEQRRAISGIAAQVEGLAVRERTPEEIAAARKARTRRPAGRPRRPDLDSGVE